MTHRVWDDAVEVQELQNLVEGVRAARARVGELLADVAVVVDLGCGTGIGASELTGVGIGIDSSPRMVTLSAGRGVPTCRAHVEAVPIRSRSVGAVRCDRVLYHVENPVHVLSEAVRITRPQGRIVCTHPDHESMVIAVPGAPAHLIDMAKRVRIELDYLDSTVPRRIPEMLTGLGCRDVHTEAYTVVVNDPDDPVYALSRWLREWRDRGAISITDAELATWDHAIEAARHANGFFFTLTYLLTHGTVP